MIPTQVGYLAFGFLIVAGLYRRVSREQTLLQHPVVIITGAVTNLVALAAIAVEEVERQ